ncbi:TetR/AcrR family transcriptional regulator [Novosphingobium sp. PC22D]|uniref:TetR/AcrR family transcriptional regulator n=1 Tax=Novosphingobium sp. PC22D TaxID=1962403 RepID=UPI00143C478C|nr:TetR/AcrR family transcriptional regulator [Novosphingobium sp. PC22D]
MLEVFWTKGYAPTSLDELAATAGINRPSLHAAFGSKHDIYLACLRHFEGRMEENIAECMRVGETKHDRLQAFFRRTIDLYLSGSPESRGCLVLCTATAEAVCNEVVRKQLEAALRALDEGMARLIAGNASPSPAECLQGELAASIVHSLAVRARSGAARAELKKLADMSVMLL